MARKKFSLEFFRRAGKRGGKKGGPIGGKRTAAKMTAEELSERARKAAAARWGKKKEGK
jgi:hypothetical protein